MKKKFIGVIGIVIVVIVGGIYYLTREEKIELSLKNKKRAYCRIWKYSSIFIWWSYSNKRHR